MLTEVHDTVYINVILNSVHGVKEGKFSCAFVRAEETQCAFEMTIRDETVVERNAALILGASVPKLEVALND